ncbi:MAG: hypothetical protein AAGI69_03475 [Cyanobacteria bacterium P01_H01_bin.21]
MNKFILGSILAAISLMAIYGTSTSNQVTSWMDGTDDNSSAQNNFGSAEDGANEEFVALNDNDAIGQINSRTPLERAGEIPQRQTINAESAPAFGTDIQTSDATDDTGGEIIEADPPEQEAQTPPAAGAPGSVQGQNQPNQNQTEDQAPIRALW